MFAADLEDSGGMSEDQTIGRKTQEIWDRNASFWDDYMGEGGMFQRLLIGPATERLLALKPGERVLDIACGNGAFSRRMAQLGAQVMACDFAPTFIERAKLRTTEFTDRIDYRVIDATDEAQLLSLGREKFDAAVCTMAMMDMPTIEPMLSALAQILMPQSRFVFSISHPCFNSGPGMKRTLEEEDRDGEIVVVKSIKLSTYATAWTYRGLGVIGQPVPQYYFHRSLSLLLNTCCEAGFVLDALEEPVFGKDAQPNRPIGHEDLKEVSTVSPRHPLGWENFKEIPPVLIGRLRLAK